MPLNDLLATPAAHCHLAPVPSCQPRGWVLPVWSRTAPIDEPNLVSRAGLDGERSEPQAAHGKRSNTLTPRGAATFGPCVSDAEVAEAPCGAVTLRFAYLA